MLFMSFNGILGVGFVVLGVGFWRLVKLVIGRFRVWVHRATLLLSEFDFGLSVGMC
jgi:hypothetical protein